LKGRRPVSVARGNKRDGDRRSVVAGLRGDWKKGGDAEGAGGAGALLRHFHPGPWGGKTGVPRGGRGEGGKGPGHRGRPISNEAICAGGGGGGRARDIRGPHSWNFGP